MQGTLCGLRRQWCTSHLCAQIWQRDVPSQYRRSSFEVRCYSTVTPFYLPALSADGPPGVDHQNQIRETENENFLARAQPFGISTIQQLDITTYQSPYSTRHTRKLLGHENLRNDFNFWKLLLDFAIHRHGIRGVKSTYHYLRYSGSPIHFDHDDEAASAVWIEMLSAAAKHRDVRLVQLLCSRTGCAWDRPELFAEVVGTLLKFNLKDEAIRMCDQLWEKRRMTEHPALELFHFFGPRGTTQLQLFGIVYRRLKPAKIYDEAMKKLWDEGSSSDAFILHKLLIREGDFPSTYASIEPFLIHFSKTQEDVAAFIREMTAFGIGFAGKARLTYNTAQQMIIYQQGGTHIPNASPEKSVFRGLSDSFAARAFATNALSFDFVLASLKAFGLTEIGPQSIRELGLSAGTLEILAQRLAKLDEQGIDIGASAYSRFVRKLCSNEEHALLQQMLKTDMHHEVFEDKALQRRLLAGYLRRCEWPQVNLILTALNDGQSNSLNSHAKTTLLLSLSGQEDGQRALLNLAFGNMVCESQADQESIQAAAHHMVFQLRSFKNGGKLGNDRLRYLRFVVGFMQEAATRGFQFTTFQWRHVLTQLGVEGCLTDVFALTYWLARVSAHELALKTTGIENSLSKLFNSQMQVSLMHWSLDKKLFTQKFYPQQYWLKCLHLLNYLERHHNVKARLGPLRKAVVIHFRNVSHVRSTTKSVSYFGQQRPSNDTWFLCSRIISTMHDLWSTSPSIKSRELELARHSIQTNKTRRNSGRVRKWEVDKMTKITMTSRTK